MSTADLAYPDAPPGALTAASVIAYAPSVDLPAPLASPARFGLLSAATVLPAPENVGMFGVEWPTPTCSVALGWPVPCTNDPVPPARTFYDRPGLARRDPFAVYWGEECGSVGADTTDARVRAGLSQGEGRAVEAVIWAELAGAGADDQGLARGVIDVVGHLEEELAAHTDFLGIIHAPVRVAAHAAANHLITWDGSVPRTPGGHVWCFGGGYDPTVGAPPADGAMLAATGPMTLWRTPVVTAGPILDRSSNRYVALAERLYVAGWDCVSVRMTIPLSA